MPPKSKPAPAAPVEPETPEVVEPTPEELETAAKHGITVESLRELRAELASEVGAAVVARQDDGLDPQAAYCGVCLPNGWPAGGNHLDCPHGTWKR